ncbi:MAG: hypothetical protein HY718_06810 [Planctomycetes bacterium]|nr:hypothetical protein [Planctomycetota bacterium]
MKANAVQTFKTTGVTSFRTAVAKRLTEEQYERFRVKQDRVFESDVRQA